MQLTLLLALIALPLSLAKNISISVGQAGIVFIPEVVTADTGDFLNFHFYPKNHSVAQSSFSSPCHPSPDGVYSGFMPETSEGVGTRLSSLERSQDYIKTELCAENRLPSHSEQHKSDLSLLRPSRPLPERNVFGCQSPVSHKNVHASR